MASAYNRDPASSTVQTQGPAYYEGIEHNPNGDAGGLEVAHSPVQHLDNSPVQPLDQSTLPQQKYAQMNWAPPPSSTPSGTYQASQEAKPMTPATYHYGYQGSPPPPPPPPLVGDDRRICGLRRTTLILSILLAVVVIVAGVGGGIAGTTAVNNAKTACQTSRPAETTPAGATPTPGSSSCSTGNTVDGFIAPTDQTLALDCPNMNNTKQSITIQSANYDFLPYCGSDYNGVTDLLAVVTYSFKDCIRACASMNFNGGKNSCVAIAFNTDIKNYVPNNYGTCFLKANTNKPNVNGRNDKVSAILT